ncbi:related to Cytochrome c1 heme lyase [Saccharomycodes ludwigii]|uniref:Holocytochrome c-type synthase n=1 Tax=Saccharomycodes ludwigii TaxID=36035 RepID=A0A376B5V0_9ASCO|nr:hypothetical protein SCDLUD_003096 [Saccharomycodes ludwigii]KAH3900128.1 hypothetical protein SCDLUD_003096 [Saccharomycodes ludwigii]SSD60053.1 related to Cytochrome c1 heme lyase [Saccharomycodes ludwigii]
MSTPSKNTSPEADSAASCPVAPEARNKWMDALWGPTPKPTSSAVNNVNDSIRALPPNHPNVENSKGEEESKCPVNHEARQVWLKNSQSPKDATVPNTTTQDIECSSTDLPEVLEYKTNVNLSEEREISSIPRTGKHDNWIYPSQKQFYEAMLRKNWKPNTDDMKTVIPIHNNINERVWNFIQMWEKNQGGDKCGGIELTSFKGDAKKLTPRAWIRSSILGYSKPFDRHDWTVNRCGKEIDYVIDFYNEEDRLGNPEIFLDVRPKLNSFEGIKMRLYKAFGLD